MVDINGKKTEDQREYVPTCIGYTAGQRQRPLSHLNIRIASTSFLKHIVNPLPTMIGVSDLNLTEDRTEVAEGCDGLILPAQGNVSRQRNIRELEAKDLECGRKQDTASGDPAKKDLALFMGVLFGQK